MKKRPDILNDGDNITRAITIDWYETIISENQSNNIISSADDNLSNNGTASDDEFISNTDYTINAPVNTSMLSEEDGKQIALRTYNSTNGNITTNDTGNRTPTELLPTMGESFQTLGIGIASVAHQTGVAIANTWDNITTLGDGETVSSNWDSTTSWDNIVKGSTDIWANTTQAVSNVYNTATDKDFLAWLKDETNAVVGKITTTIGQGISIAAGSAAYYINSLAENMNGFFGGFADYLDDSVLKGTGIGSTISGILRTIQNNLSNYKDGVTETNFGQRLESSWYGSNTTSFLNYFQNQNRKIRILSSTPLDSGKTRNSLYGTMMLGAPFLFNSYSDPNNRTLINTLIKDGKFLSLTPGLPKYNGTSYTNGDQIFNQTPTPDSMLKYLQKNGLDSDFNNKDKRYYTFKADYAAYFAYLETMLNIVWIKLGLAAQSGGEFDIFSFFDIKDINGKINASNYEKLLSQYKSSIGFFTNVAGSVTESVDSQKTSIGADLESQANVNSDMYQSLNYLTGMGTGTAEQNAQRLIGVGFASLQLVGSVISQNAANTLSAFRTGTSGDNAGRIAKTIYKIAKIATGIATDIATFHSRTDLGTIIQSFATSNGMKVKYPDLWSDSGYTRGINFNFTFQSPYGDPLSIFKYVYVPFFALLAFAMPRQAAENGYVSPFFVRADVPGLFTSDLALISNLSFTRGGANNLWTKDGLPRAIDVSISLMDLYPYLSMNKRISSLSANPSYAVFLDSFSGMLASIDSRSDEDILNRYFTEMINRVNGEELKGNLMWNKFNTRKSALVKQISERSKASISATVDPTSIPWLHNSSIF